MEIVRKSAVQRGFNVISRRWAVERTLAWLTACQRLARDYERDPAVSEAIVRWAAIAGMARRLTRRGPARRQPRYRTVSSNARSARVSPPSSRPDAPPSVVGPGERDACGSLKPFPSLRWA
ncbi:transposase [Nonomuraea sp. CA-143628]|uniref:transposase n=1 Tax=Nonomuraea sp. CA-143628 TaxID=3239997 RepID=UPI003D8CDBC1